MVLGATLVAVPGVMRFLAGGTANEPGVQLITRAAGIRDLLVGWRTVQALGRGEPVATLLRDGAVADAVDLAATLAAFPHLRRFPRLAVVAAAGGATAVGWRLAQALDQ
jgi:nicotinate-nucleotide pyrophosphorylase